jgi:hypothetical protein
MAAWQVIVLIALMALPVTLMLDFHPDRERLDARGRPLARVWQGRDRSSDGADEAPEHH